MRFIIGIDEVGRGCLAGPVTVAAVAIPVGMRFRDLRDSKKFSALQREAWLKAIRKNPKILHARANVYPKIIDRINVSQAANLAATRAFEKLMKQHKLPIQKVRVYLDGGLFLKKEVPFAKTVIKGDEKFNAIKLASIIAKVNRDRIISNNDREYPEYGLAQHKGYATKVHREAVKKYGPSEIHRLTFIKNFYRIGK